MTAGTSPTPRLDHERYCTEILEQTRLLRRTLTGVDLTARVPTCPDWSLRELAVHVGGAHRWVHEMVRTRAAEEVPEEEVPDFDGPGGNSPETLDSWLAEGAELLAAALREAGTDTPLWSWAPQRDTAFWARRMAHETVIHRADACSAVPGETYEVAPEVAADCIDEWLWLVSFFDAEGDDDLRALRERAGDSLHLHATDTPDALGDADAEWIIELTDTGLTWRRDHAKATVALRGPLADLLRVFNRRLPADTDRIEVLGDAALLDRWLESTRWG
jgi:uncharacterized protein (TIGR03083 family)